MKTRILLFAILSVLLLAACFRVDATSSQDTQNPSLETPVLSQEAIDEINNHTNFPFPLTLPEEDLKYGDEYEEMPGFDGYTLHEEGMFFWVSGWPDVQDSYHITEYRFTKPEYKLYGFTIGDTYEHAASVLEEHGYELEDSALYRGNFSKLDTVRIQLNYDQDSKEIYEIWVSIAITNKNHIMF